MKYFTKKGTDILYFILQFIHQYYKFNHYRWDELYNYYMIQERNYITSYSLYIHLKYYYIRILEKHGIDIFEELNKYYEFDENIFTGIFL